MTKYLLGIGSNVGDRKGNIDIALKYLASLLMDIKISSIYESDAMVFSNSPDDWNMPYLNLCVTGSVDMAPAELLNQILHIEQSVNLGRKSGKWAPRKLDIDILLGDNIIMNNHNLILPHPGLSHRDFVILPAIELWSDAIHPVLHYKLKDIKPSILTNVRKYED